MQNEKKRRLSQVFKDWTQCKKSLVPVKHLLVEFSHLTTCHGFRQIIAPNRHFFYRVLWVCVVFGLLCGLIKELLDKLSEFLSHDTITDLHEEYVASLEFPAITLCNVNRLTNLFEELELAKLRTLAEASYTHGSFSVEGDGWWEETAKLFHDELVKLGKEKYVLSEEFKHGGWMLDNTSLRHCAFEKHPCSLENFTRIITPMGLCYMFVANKEHRQKVPGSSHGLELYIDVNQYEYTRNPDNNITSGVKILIHDPNDPPEVEKYAPSISSGHTGHIAIARKEQHLMYQPWGPCLVDHKELRYHDKYSLASCMDECAVDYIIEKCGCKPYWDATHSGIECDAWNIINCSGKAEADFPLTMTEADCGCTWPCDSVAYEAAATAIYPSIEIEEFLEMHAYRNTSGDQVNLNEIDYAFSQLKAHGNDHVMLDIFYDSISYTTITQRKSINTVSLMSDCGGLLGLWLGISFVTIGEFLQLGIDALEIWLGIKKGYTKKELKASRRFSQIQQPPATALSTMPDAYDEDNDEDDDGDESRKDNSDTRVDRTKKSTSAMDDFEF